MRIHSDIGSTRVYNDNNYILGNFENKEQAHNLIAAIEANEPFRIVGKVIHNTRVFEVYRYNILMDTTKTYTAALNLTATLKMYYPKGEN
jgi:hypothetical protein